MGASFAHPSESCLLPKLGHEEESGSTGPNPRKSVELPHSFASDERIYSPTTVSLSGKVIGSHRKRGKSRHQLKELHHLRYWLLLKGSPTTSKPDRLSHPHTSHTHIYMHVYMYTTYRWLARIPHPQFIPTVVTMAHLQHCRA